MANPTPTKAKKILEEGVAKGYKLTKKQVKFFGAVASGKKIRGKKVKSRKKGKGSKKY